MQQLGSNFESESIYELYIILNTYEIHNIIIINII